MLSRAPGTGNGDTKDGWQTGRKELVCSAWTLDKELEMEGRNSEWVSSDQVVSSFGIKCPLFI